MQRSRVFAFMVSFVLASYAVPQAAAAPIDLDVLRSYIEIKGVHFSPDGSLLLVDIERQNFANDRYEDDLIVINPETGAQKPVARALQDLTQEAWSPDGKSIAYLAAGAAKADEAQVFVISADGGAARQLTQAKLGVQSFAFRPDGGAIAYLTPDPAPNAAAISAGLDAFEVGNQSYLSTAMPTPVHLWLQAIDGGEPQRLTSGSWSLPNGELIFPGPEVEPLPFFAWSPDNRSIVFAKMPNAYISDAVGTVTDVLDVSSGGIRQLTNHTRLEAGGIYSPDGQRIAYAYSRDDNPLGEAEIMVTKVSGGNGVDATRALDADALYAVWMEEHRVLVQAFSGTRSALFAVSDDGTSSKRLNTGDVDPVPAILDATHNGRIAFAGSESERPTEVYFMKAPDAGLVRLSDFNAAISARTQSKVQGITWRGPDGFTESGVLFYPPDFVAGKRYPLVLQIHGGPVEASIASWRDTDWPGLPQYIAAHGYVVFSPNYRGSDGQGNAYILAIFNDAGTGPGRDVMAGIDAVKRMGFVDERRIGVSGWSYGGFMTEWLITHYGVWKAAVAGAGPADAFVDYATSDYNVLGRFFFGGSPWDSSAFMQAYRAQSPLTFATRVTAPTLLIHDLYDVRVPVIHSYEFFHALRDRHIPVSFVVYPVTEHYPDDPLRSEDIYRRWAAWFDQYLKP